MQIGKLEDSYKKQIISQLEKNIHDKAISQKWVEECIQTNIDNFLKQIPDKIELKTLSSTPTES